MQVLSFTVHISVNVTDGKALYRHAASSLASIGLFEAEIRDLIGPSDTDMQLEKCLISVLNPGTAPEGTEILSTSVERIPGDREQQEPSNGSASSLSHVIPSNRGEAQ